MTQTVAAALEAAGMVKFGGEYAVIPERMQAALRRYVLEGLQPGSFLTAVICNDLRNAVFQADDDNYPLLKLYLQWLYNVAPAPCWGSYDKMQNWMRERGQERALAAAESGLLENHQRETETAFKLAD